MRHTLLSDLTYAGTALESRLLVLIAHSMEEAHDQISAPVITGPVLAKP